MYYKTPMSLICHVDEPTAQSQINDTFNVCYTTIQVQFINYHIEHLNMQNDAQV